MHIVIRITIGAQRNILGKILATVSTSLASCEVIRNKLHTLLVKYTSASRWMIINYEIIIIKYEIHSVL